MDPRYGKQGVASAGKGRHRRRWAGAALLALVAGAGLAASGKTTLLGGVIRLPSLYGAGAAAPGAAGGGLDVRRGITMESTETAWARADREQIRRYAEQTWNSIDLFISGQALPSDKLCFEPDGSVDRTGYTFIANIGAYVWSVIGARDIGLISEAEGRQRLLPVLSAVESLQRDAATAGAPAGMLLWAALVKTPTIDGSTVSSVDNAWLAAGVALMAEAYPELKPRAEAVLAKMDFAAMLNNDKGQFYNNWDMDEKKFSSGTYDLLTEARIISYLAIGEGKVPASQYFRVERWPWWRGQNNAAQFREYEGVRVYEHTQTYDGKRFMPTWGGSMFESFMPHLLIPEAEWGVGSWGRSHPEMAAAQLSYGLREFGYWGFSPSMIPATRGYNEYGAPPMGIGGYSPRGQHNPRGPTVTPHAVFLPIEYQTRATLANLAKLRRAFPSIYDERYGFRDAVDTESGDVSACMLMLDQGMAFGAMANHLTEGRLRRYLGNRYEARLKPVIAQEQFWYP